MRTILISGASRGIGRAIAEKAIDKGHRISLGLRDPNVITGTKLDPQVSGSERVFINHYDCNDENSAESWINETKNYFGKFDSIINSAGIFNRTSLFFKDHERKEIDDLLKINLMAPWVLTKQSWNELSSHGNSRIIMIVSMSGIRSKGKLAAYTVSKFALMGLCQTIRNEGWESGIRITAICPGWVNTDMAANVKAIKKSEMTQPEDIGSLCNQLLAMPNTSVPFEVKINCLLET